MEHMFYGILWSYKQAMLPEPLSSTALEIVSYHISSNTFCHIACLWPLWVNSIVSSLE